MNLLQLDEELRKRLLLLQSRSVPIAKPAIGIQGTRNYTLPSSSTGSLKGITRSLTKGKKLVTQASKAVVALYRPSEKKTSQLPQHNWGPWGKYEYLGPGTPYTRKAKAGVAPRNWLDTMAYGHDHYYSQSKRLGPGRTIMRGGADIVFGGGMIGSGFSPWSDLSLSERVLALGSGSALVVQGGVRAHPLTALPMAIVDLVFY